METLLVFELLGNSVGAYARAFGVFVVLLGVFYIFAGYILRRLGALAQKTHTDLDDTFVKIIKSLKPPFYSILSLYIALQFLHVHHVVERAISILLVIWVIYQIVIASTIFVDYVMHKFARKHNHVEGGVVDLLRKIVHGVIWAVGVLMILSNLGVNITSVVAGLGIGGVAVALALQNILSDLFSSFAIYLDKPFVVGDFVIVGDEAGTVEKIGIKTTRIRSLHGEEIVMSNRDLTSAVIHNYKNMSERRFIFSFGVVYETSDDLLKQIPDMIKHVIENTSHTRFDRAHFKEFGASALVFEVSYYVQSPVFNVFMDTQQAINFGILAVFHDKGIEMAYPTKTVYLKK